MTRQDSNITSNSNVNALEVSLYTNMFVLCVLFLFTSQIIVAITLKEKRISVKGKSLLK